MSDARSRHAVEETTVMRCHCLAHGRRQFSDRAEVFPLECQVVIDTLTQVCDHDAETREQQMRPAARFAYHQESSQPLMDARRQWLQKQGDAHLVEPNSALGKAIASMQTHWETLTRFFSIPGAPLENTLVEVRFVGQNPGFPRARRIGPRCSKEVFEEPENLIPVSVSFRPPLVKG